MRNRLWEICLPSLTTVRFVSFCLALFLSRSLSRKSLDSRPRRRVVSLLSSSYQGLQSAAHSAPNDSDEGYSSFVFSDYFTFVWFSFSYVPVCTVWATSPFLVSICFVLYLVNLDTHLRFNIVCCFHFVISLN